MCLLLGQIVVDTSTLTGALAHASQVSKHHFLEFKSNWEIFEAPLKPLYSNTSKSKKDDYEDPNASKDV